MIKDEKQSRTYIYLAILLPALVTGFGSFYAGKNDKATLESIQLKNAYEQNNLMRKETDSYRNQIFKQGKDIVDLISKLQEKTDDYGMLESLLDGLPFPAWIKEQREDGKMIIVMINEAYTVHFGLTKTRAVGKTNEQLFPGAPKIAEEYERNDLLVIESKDYIKRVERVTARGLTQDILVYKFMIGLPEHVTGVGGVSVHGLTQQCADSMRKQLAESNGAR